MKKLFFDAEDFMWSDGKPLTPSQAADQANKMFTQWQVKFYEQSSLFKPVKIKVPKGLSVVVEVDENRQMEG